jgi:hypothetical protein
MEILIIIGVVSAIFFTVKLALKETSIPSSTSSNNQKEITVETINETEDFVDGSFNTYIAGVNHHCDYSDIGGFVGVVAPEPNNPYDKNAIAIYRNDSNPKLLGYISKSELAEYRQWCDNKPFTCVGYIIPGDESPVYGKIKVIKPYNEDFVKSETDSYVRWMIKKYGSNFLPKGYVLD